MTEIRVSEHPRARAAIRRTKGGAGLATLVLVVLLSVQAGLTYDQALARALPAGIAAYLVAWAAAVTVWRQLVLAELQAAHARRAERIEQAGAQLSADA